MSSHLVEIVRAHMETVKDGGSVLSICEIIGNFDKAAILDFGQIKNGNHFFLKSNVSKI